MSPGDNVTEVRPWHKKNAIGPHVVIDAGIITDVRPEPENASSLIDVSPGDNVTEVSFKQPKNA